VTNCTERGPLFVLESLLSAADKPCCAIVFLMIFTLGVSLGLSAEDVLDAVYDESEYASGDSHVPIQ